MKKKKFSKKENENIIINKKSRLNRKSILVAIIGLGIISIMVGSALNLWGENTEKQEYNEYKFIKDEGFNGGWNSYINGKYYSFEYLPQEVKDLGEISFDFNLKEIYILFDPEDFEAVNRIYSIKTLFNEFGKVVFPACIKEEGCGDLPIVSCSEIVGGVYLVNSENNKFYKENNCLVMGGNDEYYLKSINYLKYKMLGVL